MLSSLSGVYSAAHDLNVEWIIIKGVSDFADGKNSEKNAWRPFASIMAASFVAHILSNPIIFEDWPHYNNGKTSLPPSSGDYQTDVFNFSNDNYKTNNQQCSKIQQTKTRLILHLNVAFFLIKNKEATIAAKLLTDSFQRRTSQYKSNRF